MGDPKAIGGETGATFKPAETPSVTSSQLGNKFKPPNITMSAQSATFLDSAALEQSLKIGKTPRQKLEFKNKFKK